MIFILKLFLLTFLLFGQFMQLFPKPTGSYAVGTIIKHVIDESREESFSQEVGAKRELLIKIWYPADTTDNQLTPYAQDIMHEWAAGLKQTGFPEEQIKELSDLKTYANENASINKKGAPYPFILFSPGYVALLTAYTAYCEELASQGYIVVAIGHAYYTQLLKFPDGKTIAVAEQTETQQQLIKEKDSKKEQELWLQDVQFVLDQLEHMNADDQDILYGLLDFDRIGMLGHSFGGSTAIQMLRNDDRIKAAVDLDGGLFGKTPTKGIEKPIMFIVGKESFDAYAKFSDEEIARQTGFPKDVVSVLRKKYYEYIPELFKASRQAYLITIDTAKHGVFSDWSLLKDLPLYRDNRNLFDLEQSTGAIDGKVVIGVINHYLIAFFDKFLKEKETSIDKAIREIIAIEVSD
jgi:dienelactone hydrolase